MPLVVAILDGVFAFTQAKLEDKKHDAEQRHQEEREDFDRATNLLERVISKDPVEKIEALVVLKYYVGRCDFAKVAVPVVLLGLQDGDDRVKQHTRDVIKHSQRSATSHSTTLPSFYSIQL